MTPIFAIIRLKLLYSIAPKHDYVKDTSLVFVVLIAFPGKLIQIVARHPQNNQTI